MSIVLFMITFLVSLTGFSEPRDSLAKDIQIKSVYHDSHQKDMKHLVVGTGSLIEYSENNDHHYFLLTAAHVSQGTCLDIQINNKSANLIDLNSKIFDNEADIELIEITNNENYLPLATYQKEDSKGNPAYLKVELELGSEDIYFKETMEPLTPYYVGVQFDSKTSKVFPIASFIHYNPLIAHNPNGENYRFKHKIKPSELDQIEESSYGNTLYTPNSGIIGAGMSGSPLIQSHRVENEIIQSLDGVAIQYLRFGSKSYFASSNAILNLLQKYIKNGKRGNIGNHIWKSENGFLYREFCLSLGNNNCSYPNATLNSREIVPQTQSAGGGIVGERGGSGGGELCGTPYVHSKLKHVDHEIALGTHEISAPIKINDQEVLGFKVNSKNSDEYLYIDANDSGRDYINQNKENIDVKIVGTHFDAIELFLNHYKNQLNKPIEFPLIFSYNEKYNTKVSISEDRIDIQIPGIQFKDKENPQILHRDKLIFSLDKSGHQITNGIHAPQFRPVIKVIGNLTHEEYYLDIRQLFFLDLSEIPKNNSFYLIRYNHDTNISISTNELISRSYKRGGIINSNSYVRPSDNLIIQLYLP